MRHLKTMIALSALAAAGALNVAPLGPETLPAPEPADRTPPRRPDYHKPGNNKPVAGGGARERARRAARLNSNPEE
jgi:hypothetical protein